MDQDQFIKTQATQFLNEIPRIHNPQDYYNSKQEFQNLLQQHEEEIYRKMSSQDVRQLQESGQLNLFMEHLQRQMISEASTNLRYQRLTKDVDAPAPEQALELYHSNPYFQQQNDVDLHKEFQVRAPHFNGNTSKNFWKNSQAVMGVGVEFQQQQNSQQQPLLCKEDFAKVHYNIMNPPQTIQVGAPGAPDPQTELLKQNIELLGGIDDCVGQMEATLNEYEIKNLNEKYIHYYTFHNKILQKQREEQMRASQEQQSQQNPFLFNPKNVLEQSEFNKSGGQFFNKNLYGESKTNQSTQQQFYPNSQYKQFQQHQSQQPQQAQQQQDSIIDKFAALRKQKEANLNKWGEYQGF